MGVGFVFSSADAIPKWLIVALHLLDILLYSSAAVLHRLGLNPCFEAEHPPWEYSGLHLSGVGPQQAVAATPESVKRRMPVDEYWSLVKRNGGCGGNQAAPPAACAVCLQPLEARDEVRDLGTCRHPFHVACIDRWVDMGRFTCPLCRGTLLPPPHRRTSAAAGLLALLKLLVPSSGEV
ncbi:RING-H2 finger protein ATL28 [Apostasia shenzhenica]|uniref:RING-H2 finger protein ATL28 n=1 Tax=Apostasia shenzhenica TaxID=1088818 RepID=A0A2I0AXB9_9ASPA|nr:RING-H2 finger protein ATL28 [Apostasia shenzhenica]